jgi:hypothetical protein
MTGFVLYKCRGIAFYLPKAKGFLHNAHLEEQRGPILRQHDFLAFIAVSKHANSVS